MGDKLMQKLRFVAAGLFLSMPLIFGCSPTNQKTSFDAGAITFNGYGLELDSVAKVIDSNQFLPEFFSGQIESSHTLKNKSAKDLRFAWPPRRVDFLSYDSLTWDVQELCFEVVDSRLLNSGFVSLKPGESFRFETKIKGGWLGFDSKKPLFFSFVFSGCGEDEPNVVNVVGSITSEKPARLK